VGSFKISEGNITERGKKNKQTQNTHLTATPKHRSSPGACIHHQRAGAQQGGAGCMLRVRTRPERPEDNLRELT